MTVNAYVENEWVENTGTVPSGLVIGTEIETEYRDGFLGTYSVVEDPFFAIWIIKGNDYDIIRWRIVK